MSEFIEDIDMCNKGSELNLQLNDCVFVKMFRRNLLRQSSR
jgi:hypothetical protein